MSTRWTSCTAAAALGLLRKLVSILKRKMFMCSGEKRSNPNCLVNLPGQTKSDFDSENIKLIQDFVSEEPVDFISTLQKFT